MKTTPKVYARRPPCKWWAYACHRPVKGDDTLCEYHRPMALTKNRIDQFYKAGYKGPLTLADVERLETGLAFDGGCDCETCLRAVPA